MVEGYFDESGSLDHAGGVFCVAGYFISDRAAKLMDEEWAKVLDEHQLPYFHMVDCAHGAGPFAGKPVEERSEIAKKLIGLIKKYTLEGFSAIAQREVFDASEDVYSHCVEMAVTALQVFLKQFRIQDDLAFFFEQGHSSKGRAYARVADQLSTISGSLTFAAKKEVRLLQAADLLAWQTTKYVKDRFSQARPPRKDFVSLMEHPHSLFHLFVQGGEKTMGLEAFPMSRRAQKSITLEINKDGPITFFKGEEDGPVVPIEKAESWRLGAGRMAYVTFKDAGEKRFHLAFDELRLFESARLFLQATEAYADTGIACLLPAEAMTVVRHKGAVVLQIKIVDGGRLAIAMSEEGYQQLKDGYGEKKD